MALSHELLSQFAKLVTKNDSSDSESTVYGTIVVDGNGNKYVKLYGSDQLTPLNTDTSISADSAVANFNEGERVSVLIKNHTATITGNVSSPAARSDDVTDLGNKVTEIEEREAILADSIQANYGYIQELQSDKANIGDLTAATAKIDELEVKKASIEELDAVKIDVEDLKATKIDADILDAKYATIENLDATSIAVGQLEAANVDITQKLTAAEASIIDLEVNKLSAQDANITYANIDFANIGEAAIKKIFSESGLIRDLVVGDSTITGELVGVTIKGDLIEAGTLKADRLVVKGSDGKYYKLNTDFAGMPDVEPVEEDTIHGSVLIANSITAEKVAVDDLVAFDATIGGFEITETAIHSVAKDSATNSTSGIYMDKEGQLSVGDSVNYLKYYREADGSYKLAISASDIVFSASGKSVEDIVNDIEVGARNLIRNSKNLIFKNYYFINDIAIAADGNGNVTWMEPDVDVSVGENGDVAINHDVITVYDDGNGNINVYLDI